MKWFDSEGLMNDINLNHCTNLQQLNLAIVSFIRLLKIFMSIAARVSGHVLDEPDLDKEFMEEMHIICGLARKGSHYYSWQILLF